MCAIFRKTVVVVVMFLTFLTTEVFAREFRDTIRIQMPNGTTMEYGINYRRLHVYKSYSDELKTQSDLKDKLNVFLKRWAVLGITDLEDKEPMFIDNSENKITISNRKNVAEVEFPKDTKLALTVKGRHKLKLVLKDSDVFIYFDTIEQLEELEKYNMENILKEGDGALELAVNDRKKRRMPLKAWLSVNEYNQVGLTYQKFIEKESLPDYLTVSYSPNIENINGDWLAGVGFNLAFYLSRKGVYFYRISLGYEGMFKFEGNKTNNGQWVDLGYAINGERIGLSWFGFSLGYLVDRRGDFFDNHKFRMGFPTDIGTHITVTPLFYFKDFFKESPVDEEFFGVKISFKW